MKSFLMHYRRLGFDFCVSVFSAQLEQKWMFKAKIVLDTRSH